MLQLLGNRIQGQVMGKPVSAQTLPTAFAAGRIKGVFQLLPPGFDPVFGEIVIAISVHGGGSGGNRQGYDQAALSPNPDTASARMVEWKMPVGARADVWKAPVSAGGEIIKMPTAARVDPMKIRVGAKFWKVMMPPGGASAFKVTMPAGGASFPKMRMPSSPEPASFKWGPTAVKGGSAALRDGSPVFKGGTPTFKGGAVAIPFEPIVLAQRMIPGRNCLVVTAGFSDLLDALRAAGGDHLEIV